jgi:hypothetical protein
MLSAAGQGTNLALEIVNQRRAARLLNPKA